MKKNLILILGGIGLFFFIFLITIGWYNIFYNDKENQVAILNIELSQKGEVTINEENAYPLSDEDGAKVTPYSFNVNNESSNDGAYKVYLDDIKLDTSKSLLKRNQLSYQLSLNGKLIKKGTLDELNDNILDERLIEAGQNNQYELRVYVSEDAFNTDWQQKYYAYKIKVETEEIS